MKNLVILTGAGMSSESGINTFRDSGGLWENYPKIPVYIIDPNDIELPITRNIELIKEKASAGVAMLTQRLFKTYLKN